MLAVPLPLVAPAPALSLYCLKDPSDRMRGRKRGQGRRRDTRQGGEEEEEKEEEEEEEEEF